MNERAPESTLSAAQRAAGLSAAGVLVVGGLYTLRDFVPGLAWAVVIAIGVWPVFQRLHARWPKHGRGLLPALTIVAVVLALVLPMLMVGVPVFEDARAVAGWIEQSRVSGLAPPSFLQHVPYGAQLTELWWRNFGQPGAISAMASGSHASVLEMGRHFGSAALRRLMTVGVMLLALFFLLRDADGLADQLRVASLRAIGPAGERVALQVVRAVQGTVNGLVLVGLAEGLILGIAYWIAGVPNPAVFGLVTALLAMVPFGAALAIGAAALALVAGDQLIAALAIAAFGLILTFLADHFVRPVLIGGATRLPFLWVLLGILGGVRTWGLVGLFVGPALLSVLILLWREYVGRQAGPIGRGSGDAGTPGS
jgi:predicted PurR-regulated permease PerM